MNSVENYVLLCQTIVVSFSLDICQTKFDHRMLIYSNMVEKKG